MNTTLLRTKTLFVGLVLAVSSTLALAADKVVYHVDDTALQATRTLRSLRNH